MNQTKQTKSSVLVIGESIIDVVQGEYGIERHPGGSPLNVAYGLSRLGVPTGLLTRIGRDRDGTAIRKHLNDAGTELLPLSVRDEATNQAIATIAADGGATYEFAITWELPQLEGVRVPGWVHVGSLATFLNPGADSLERFLYTRAGRTRISYDPNIRPSLIPDHQSAVARFERIARISDVVKLSDEDARWLYPQRRESDVLDGLLALGVSIVALTRGGRSASLSTARARIEVPAIRIVPVDTIGAGDSFMAALIAELLPRDLAALDRAELDRAALVAMSAAAMTCTTAGANPPTREDLAEWMRGP